MFWWVNQKQWNFQGYKGRRNSPDPKLPQTGNHFVKAQWHSVCTTRSIVVCCEYSSSRITQSFSYTDEKLFCPNDVFFLF